MIIRFYSALLTYTFILISGSAYAEESTSLMKDTGFRQFSTEQGLSQNTVNSFYQDSHGLMWIATEAGLNRLDGSHIEAYTGPQELLRASAISKVKEDSHGALWVSSFDNLYRVDNTREKIDSYALPKFTQSLDEQNFVIDVLEEDSSGFWIVTRLGLMLLQQASNDIQLFRSMNELHENNIRVTMALNDENTIWLATTKGLYRFNKSDYSITRQPLQNRLNDNILTEILKVDESTLFVASIEGAVLLEWDSATPKQTIITSDKVDSIARRNSQLFYAIKDRLYLYDRDRQKSSHIFSLSEILPRYSNYRIRELFFDRQEKLWIGTESQGAYLWDPNSLKFETISSITENSNLKLSDNTVWSFTEDEQNNLWIGTDDGLDYLNIKESTIQHYLTKDLPGMTIDSARILNITSQGDYLWLATGNGLIRFARKTGAFKVYRPLAMSTNESFFIYSLTQTPQGILWLATGNGPISFNPKTEKFHYDKTLNPNDEAEEATLIRYFDGLIWIGYANRLDTFDPTRGQKNTIFKFGHLQKSYDLSLTDFYVDGNRLWVSFNAAGIYILDLKATQTTVLKHFDQKDGFIDNIIHTMLPYGDFIWASSHSGLIKINKDDFSYDIYDYYNGLPTNEFNEGAGYTTQEGHLLFGGANGLLKFSPERLELPSSAIAPAITAVTINDNKLFSNGINWKDRALSIDEQVGIIQFDLSTLDYLSPYKWQYEYWLTGDVTTDHKRIKGSRITLQHLSEGSYQLNVRAVLSDTMKFDQVTQLPFHITKPHAPYLWIKILITAMIIILLAGYFYRRNRSQRLLFLENQQLQQEKQRMELALLGHQQGIWEWRNLTGKLADSNITMFIQQSENQVFSLRQYPSQINQEDLKKNRRQWLSFLRGDVEEITLTYRIFLFEKWIWCRIQGKLYQRDESGTPVRATGTWFDISEERKVAEQLLYFKHALQSTRDIVFILNQQLDITFINHSYEKLTGFSIDSLLGKNLIDMARNRFQPELTAELESHLKAGKPWQGEATMPTKNAPSFPVDIRIDQFSPSQKEDQFIVIMTDISSLSHRMESQLNSSYIDSVTGLPNRILAQDRLSHALAHAKMHSTNVVLIYIDLDKFDFYQQTLGKSNSREIIVNVSKQISSVLNKDDTFARVERDKFYLILENEEKLENIAFRIEEVLTQLSTPQKVGTSQFQVTACVGVSCYPQDARTADKLITCAKSALRQAQAMGHNKINYFHKEMNKRASDRLAMKSSLDFAIKNNQFFLVFQPKFTLKDRQLNGFEVFVRWRTADGNIVYPSQFIKIAEETGLIESLTEWLINQAFRTLRQWKQDGINSVFAINLIPKYCQHVGSPKYLEQKLDEYNLSSMNVQIEINEKQFADDLNKNLKFITELSESGFNITLDDFGIGNIPLNYLKNLSISSVKLERNFIRSIGKDKSNDALVKAIINMANALDYTPAAKSIEYAEQLTFLLEAGCKVGQGYFFADPMSENSARQFILKQEENIS